MAIAIAESPKDIALLPPRLAFGATMLYHGTQKLKPQAVEPTAQAFESMGLKPGKPLAVATGAAEVLAGLTAILGIATRIGAIAALTTQAIAILKVHAPKGFDSTKGGFEFNLALIAVASALLIGGPGKLSLHEWIERTLTVKKFPFSLLPGTKSRREVKLVKLLK